MPTEILNVVFGYRAVYRMPRKRNLEDEHLRGETPLAIESLTDAEAPVVCRVRNPADADRPEELYDYVIRAHDGRFWRHVGTDHTDKPIALADLRTLVAAPADGSRTWDRNPFRDMASPTGENEYRGTGWLNKRRTMAEIAPKEVIRNEYDEAVARLSRGAAGLRLVEGVLCEECAEPRIVVGLYGGRRVEFKVSTEEAKAPSSREKHSDLLYRRAVFRMDRVKEARSHCARLIRSEDVPKWGLAKLPRIDTPHPEFLKRDDLVDSVRALAPQAMKEAREIVGWMPRGKVMDAFLDMRDALDRVGAAEGSRADADAFCGAFAKVAAWAQTVTHEDRRAWASDMPYTSLRKDHHLLDLWTRYEGGVIEAELAEEDGEALAAFGPEQAL